MWKGERLNLPRIARRVVEQQRPEHAFRESEQQQPEQ